MTSNFDRYKRVNTFANALAQDAHEAKCIYMRWAGPVVKQYHSDFVADLEHIDSMEDFKFTSFCVNPNGTVLCRQKTAFPALDFCDEAMREIHLVVTIHRIGDSYDVTAIDISPNEVEGS